LISYPYECRSFGPKTTKRMGAVAECDFYRDGRHSIENDFEFGHASIWYGAGNNASGNLEVVNGVGRQFRADHQTLAVPKDRRQLEGISTRTISRMDWSVGVGMVVS
jgi:hypothetical protein